MYIGDDIYIYIYVYYAHIYVCVSVWFKEMFCGGGANVVIFSVLTWIHQGYSKAFINLFNQT